MAVSASAQANNAQHETARSVDGLNTFGILRLQTKGTSPPPARTLDLRPGRASAQAQHAPGPGDGAPQAFFESKVSQAAF